MSIIQDMVDDLSAFSVFEIEQAIQNYRKAPMAPGKTKYFPESGQLVALATAMKRDVAPDNPDNRKPQFGEGRPCRWWQQSRKLWAAGWREEEIPPDEIELYRKWRAKGHGA